MKYLALDQATRVTGWAIYDEDKNLKASGKFSIAANKDMGKRLAEFINEINVLWNTFNFDKIFYEGIQYQNNAETYKKLAYIQAILLYFAQTYNIPVKEMTPSHWRSILKDKHNWKFGRARAEQKKKAQEFVEKHSNIVESEDVCDAICLGLAALYEEDNYKSAF